jgi:microsomal dipeptidase-like Zn-dependent dipeptidase
LVAAAYQTALPSAFKQRGWSDDRIERICNGNFRRVLGAVWW